MMRRILLAPLLAVSLVGFAKAQGTTGNEADTEEIKKEVLKAEDEQNQALQRGDTDVLGHIYADDLAYTNADGKILTKAQHLAEFRSGIRKFDSIRRDDINLHVYGNTVVLTGRSTSTLQYKGKVTKGPRRFTDVYIKRDGRWLLVAHQVTDVAKE